MPSKQEAIEKLTFKECETERRVFYCLDGGERELMTTVPESADPIVKQKIERAERTLHRQSKLLSLLVHHLENSDLISPEELDDMLLEVIH